MIRSGDLPDLQHSLPHRAAGEASPHLLVNLALDRVQHIAVQRAMRKPARRSRTSLRASRLAVVVQLELVRVRAQPQFVELDGPLVIQPGLDEVGGEYAALGEVGVVAL